jgi:hypothetical protein
MNTEILPTWSLTNLMVSPEEYTSRHSVMIRVALN